MVKSNSILGGAKLIEEDNHGHKEGMTEAEWSKEKMFSLFLKNLATFWKNFMLF